MPQRRKISIDQTTFGFGGEEKKTAIHDEIVLWLRANSKDLISKILNWNSTWDSSMVDKFEEEAVRIFQNQKKVRRIPDPSSAHKYPGGGLSSLDSMINDAPEIPAEEVEKTKFQSNLENEKWHGLGEPPAKRLEVQSTLEEPIIQCMGPNSQRVVAYLDIVIQFRQTQLSVSTAGTAAEGETLLQWHHCWDNPKKIAFDAKPEIRSLGDTIRQFKTYKVFRPDLELYIVSRTKQFAEVICEQGFGFISYPEGEIFRPSPPPKW
jgi:hypothetical protein